MTSTRTRLLAVMPVLATLAGSLVVFCAPPAHAGDTMPRPPVGGPLLASTDVVVSVPPGAAPLPKVRAKSFLVADLASGEVIAAKNAHGRFRPASAIKMLTALTLLPRLDPASVYKASFADADVEGSRVGIVPGGTYTVHNLMEGMFLVSGNDASRALAGAAGGLPATVRQMNETARELGALDTTAKNASGLDEPGQYSSAYDLALFARAGMERADFRRYAKTVKSRFPAGPAPPGKTRKSFEIHTQNKLVLNYPGAVGIKTGWTTQAQGTFIGAATRNGRTLVVTLMYTGQGAWREAGALLDWGFTAAPVAKPVGTLDAALDVPTTTAQVSRAAAAAATAANASTGDAGASVWQWLGRAVATIVVLVVLLRTRVLVRRHLRRRRRAAMRSAVPRAVDRVPAPRPAQHEADSALGRVGRSA